MMVINSNNITVFDVDNTIVMYDKFRDNGPNKIKFNYGNEDIYLTPHKFHITFLKHCYNRGDTVILWSMNGYQWAEQVAKTLGIEKYIHICMSKPSRHVDDKEEISKIVGERVYLPNE